VLVRDGSVIGQGHHTHFGGPHAEPTALADCAARGHSPTGATAYVTLEPCCHTNKKTPPCAPQLITAKITRVVIGCLDPNPDVNGKGVAMLRAAGILVDRACVEIESACRQLIAPFLLRVKQNRPYITLKWAQTADGKIAGPRGKRLQITGAAANRAVHQLRARSDAIMVGVKTILADDPQLTARGVGESRLMTRIILDTNLNTPPSAKVFVGQDRLKRTVIFHSSRARVAEDGRVEKLLKAGAMLAATDRETPGAMSLQAIFANGLFGEVTHLIVEPGPTLARSMFEANFVDRLWVFRSQTKIRNETAPAAAEIPKRFVVTGSIQLGEDVLTEYLNANSEAFFAAEPSADLQITEF
jgi:diaminohydroxyphosphoribosylaminopyrimidine deaminase/5-amino-6-(5-phosphoribosylamino)uracil reductase